MSLIHDIAASEPADIAHVILALRGALVELLEEGVANRAGGSVPSEAQHTVATQRAHKIVNDLDAGELLWPGWRPKEKAAS